MDLSQELKAPFTAKQVHWRVGATNVNKDDSLKWGDNPVTIPLAYLDARDVMERLDEVFGVNGWQAEYPFQGCCRIGALFAINSDAKNLQWLWKSNGADVTQVEGVKGQYSDSFKRAAVLFGIGRYLYDLKTGWMPLEKKGNSHVLSKETQLDLNERYDLWVAEYFKPTSE